MSIFENLKKVLKNVVFLGDLDHNALVHRKSNFCFVMIIFSHIFEKKLGVFIYFQNMEKKGKNFTYKNANIIHTNLLPMLVE